MIAPQEEKYMNHWYLNDAGNLPRELKICTGTRVMRIRNIMTSKGLVNGAMGTVTYKTYNGELV